MRCLYEVLGIAQDADEGTLKSAYKKAAFRWHPDKNQDNLQAAEENFKEIQNAYEVLSDKHERAWYDAHRNEILRQGERHQAGGGESFARGQAPEDDITLFPFFSSTCFNGYKDGPMGFYGVYEDLFSRLDEQEIRAEEAERNESNRTTAPKFGSSQAEWPQISVFYSWWGSFSTAKTFSWADKYNPASAPNRKVRRLMEEENRKLRKTKRREFNETVRELVAFVKKRDKRVAAYQAEEARQKHIKESEERARREEERRDRLQRAREFEEAAWAAAEAEVSEGEEAADEEPPDELYCLACDKLFRTPNAMANHNKSKKHLEKVALLREVLAADDELQHAASEAKIQETSSAGTLATDSSSAAVHESSSVGETSAHVEQPRTGIPASSTRGHYDAPNVKSSNVEDSSPGEQRRSSSREASQSSEVEDGTPEDDEMLSALLRMQHDRQQKAQPSGIPEQGTAGSVEPLDTNQWEGSSNEPGTEDAMTERLDAIAIDEKDEGDSQQGETNPKLKRIGKKSRRRKVKADSGRQKEAVPAQIDGKEPRREDTQKRSVGADAHTCSVCGTEFDSRTKMFSHIRASGHAALKG